MKKKKNSKTIYFLFFIAALFFGAFVLIEFHKDYLAVAGAFFIVLIAAYLAIDKFESDLAVNKEKEINRAEEEHHIKMEYFMELEKVQKASYVALKKNTATLEEQFFKLSEKAELISEQSRVLEELHISVRKDIEHSAAALHALEDISDELRNGFKVIVKYNKENAKQVALNTNAQIAKLLKKLENLPASGGSSFDIEMMNEQYDNLSTAMLENTITVSDRLERLERITGTKADEDFDLPDSSEEDEGGYGEIEESGEDLTVAAAEPELEVLSQPEPVSDPNAKMSSDDIAALLASMGGNEPEPVKVPEPASDPNAKMSPDDIAALLASMGGNEPEPEPEPIKVPEPASDPNAKMSPDDIAALLASMGGNEPEPEPVKVPEPASDPNKMMGPDDIAALLASMGN